ncbi:MAG: histidine--tRNA ligase [Bacilli bacterium]|nr:histidine--tRNA ligase [Bacilli bacterium]
MKIQNVKGCNDYLPQEQKIRNYINDKLKETFKEFGYQPIETPILCYYDMLIDKYDENNDLVKEIYKLTDQGKRELGLRYDLTVPFAKFIALNKNQIRLPFKRYEIAKVFRDGPVKLGRDREFTQCDVDVVGLSGQMIEAECLNLYVNAFQKLGIEIEIEYNSRNLMRGLILDCSVEDDKISSVITIIDKMDKLSKEEFKETLQKIGLNDEQTEKLLQLFKLSLLELNEKYQDTNIRELKTGLEELNSLNCYINSLNIDKYCKFTPTLARGQDYYTGNVFEVYEKTRKLSSSIGGGGRYDNMITNYIGDGNTYPAVGISFGLSSIYELLKNNEEISNKTDIQIYLIPMETEAYTLKIANELRKKNIHVIIEMTKRKIKKCFEWADKQSIPYVIVIGENEIKTNHFMLKNMKSATSKEYSFDNIEQLVNDIKNV